MTASKSLRWIPLVVVLSIVLLACTCWGAFKALAHSIDAPPEISAEYRSGEALLVMEDLAGEILAAIVEETGSSPFVERGWDTTTCSSGWDGHILWEGYVSASVSYSFAWGSEDDVSSIDYGEYIADALKSLGMEPEVESEGRKTVQAERDDGLRISYFSGSSLLISTSCVVEGGPYVYTPPHGNVSPANDYMSIEDQ